MTLEIDTDIIERQAAANPEPQALLSLVCDTSSSMSGAPIDALNAALPRLRTEIEGDALASKRVRIGISAFPPNECAASFVQPSAFSPPKLIATGVTPLGAAALQALLRTRAQMSALTKEGIHLYRPMIFILSDGRPTDDYREIAASLAAADKAGELNVFAVGIGDADLNALAAFTHQFAPVRLDGLKFGELFRWISVNVKAVSHSHSHNGSKPNERVPLTSIQDWAKQPGA